MDKRQKQHQVEQWKDEKEMETIIHQKINLCRIQREMNKTDTQFQAPPKKR
jgi:hypothetical protein